MLKYLDGRDLVINSLLGVVISLGKLKFWLLEINKYDGDLSLIFV